MSAICRPCLALVPPNPCPDLFSGGTIPTPIPTRQRVCNTEQTASCPDGSNPQIVAAGTFCTVVLNPTASSIATTQAAMNAQALSQAQSQVGSCAWVDMVWTPSGVNDSGPATDSTIHGEGNGGVFSGLAFVECVTPNGGTRGLLLLGDINFTYGPGEVKHHRLTGSFVNTQTNCGGVWPVGIFACQVYLAGSAAFPPTSFDILTDYITLQPCNQAHAGTDPDKGLGTFPFDFHFTTPGTMPYFVRLFITTTVYCPTGVSFLQTFSGSIVALD